MSNVVSFSDNKYNSEQDQLTDKEKNIKDQNFKNNDDDKL